MSSCNKCGCYACVCFSQPMTPEAQAVLDAALEHAKPEDCFMGREGRAFKAAVDAYRASLRPAPRYIVRDKCVVENVDRFEQWFCSTHTQADAEKIAAALNSMEEK